MARVIPHTLDASARSTGGVTRMALSAHTANDYLPSAGGVATGEWRATSFLVGVGAAQVALTASTRRSAPAGA
jgi:hypothetical protein